MAEHEIIRDHATKKSRGFGFVVFESEKVVDSLLVNGNMIDMAGTQVIPLTGFLMLLGVRGHNSTLYKDANTGFTLKCFLGGNPPQVHKTGTKKNTCL